MERRPMMNEHQKRSRRPGWTGPLCLLLALVLFPGGSATAQKAGSPPGTIEVPRGDATKGGPKGPTQEPTKVLLRQEVEERLEVLLSGHEFFPQRSHLDALASPDTISQLARTFAVDPNRRPSLRLRAVDLLGYYGDDDTARFLQKLLEENSGVTAKDHLHRRLQHRALMALAKGQKSTALPILQPMLHHQDLQLQLSAVSAIGKHGGAKGLEILSARATTATHPALRRELRKYIPLP